MECCVSERSEVHKDYVERIMNKENDGIIMWKEMQ